MTSTLPPFLNDLLRSPPRAGEGVHQFLFRVARQLHAHYPATEVMRILESAVAQCGRTVTRKEIVDAVQNSIPVAWQPKGNAAPVVQAVRKWPGLNGELREAIIRGGGGLADLWELSPVRIDDNDQHTAEIITRLFPGNPLLCVGKYIPKADGATEHYTKPREEWHDLEQWELIVPSPMTAPTGLTKDGKESAHALDNTGPRRFLICEFDAGTTDEQAALLIHLAGYAPMVCALHSGGKSMHGWFLVHGQPDARIEKFFRYAVSLGADSRLWARSQFCRIPDGTRTNGKRQTVYFLSFKPLQSNE